MSHEEPDIVKKRLRRVTVVVRSWDGPNSRVGFEMDLNEMPWGPFDALGQKLHLLLPSPPESKPGGPEVESEVSKALRHVEHAADRCGEFAQASNGSREVWLESQRTWEWVRRHLTRLWIQQEVEGDTAELLGVQGEPEGEPGTRKGRPAGEPLEIRTGESSVGLPSLPGAAATLRAAAKALRHTSLSTWRDTVEAAGPEGPTREEAIRTLLGVAKILEARSRGEETPVRLGEPGEASPGAGGPQASRERNEETPDSTPSRSQPVEREEPDFEQVSVEFAEGYDQGYQMGRKVGWALGSRDRREPRPGKGRGTGGD